MKKLLSLLLPFCLLSTISAQSDTTYSGIATVVFLDSFVVTAQRQGFQVDDFIELVQKDESFYNAFKNVRFVSTDFTNELVFFDKKGNEKAYHKSVAQQLSDGECRIMNLENEVVKGNFYKNKNKKKRKYRYYTAKMYDRVFFTHGRKCGDPYAEPASDLTGMDKHINELKKLIFQPGRPVNVPIVGNKTAIFSEALMPYYNYSITSKLYDQSRDCYVFTAEVKPEFQTKKVDKTIIKFLETYFDKTTFQVVARRYHLQYSGLAFDFDVKMEIELQQVEKNKELQYLPQKISYNGWWDIPMRKPEIGTFTLELIN